MSDNDEQGNPERYLLYVERLIVANSMKQLFAILLRFIALVALYMLISWAFGMFETFSVWRMLLMGAVFSGIMLGFSEWQNNRR